MTLNAGVTVAALQLRDMQRIVANGALADYGSHNISSKVQISRNLVKILAIFIDIVNININIFTVFVNLSTFLESLRLPREVLTFPSHSQGRTELLSGVY
jgi:hypothetical protein